MPLPAILAALGRGAAVAARAALQAAVAAGRAGVSAAATGAKTIGQGAASIGKAAINVARPGLSATANAVKSAATGTATRIAAVANPASLQAAAKSAVSSAASAASAAGQSASNAASAVGRAGQQASQSLSQFARNAMQNMQQAAQAAIGRAGGAGNVAGGGGTSNSSSQVGGSSSQATTQPSTRGPLPGAGDMLNPGKQLEDSIRKMAELPGKLKAFGDSLVEGRRSLLDYNGSIAESVHRLDSERIQRQISLAGATAGSAKYQSEAHNRLEKALAPGFTAMTNVMNKVVGVLEHGLSYIIEGMSSTAQKILDAMPGKIGERFKKALEDVKSAPSDMPLNKFLDQMQKGEVFRRNMPPIHKRPGVGDTGPRT